MKLCKISLKLNFFSYEMIYTSSYSLYFYLRGNETMNTLIVMEILRVMIKNYEWILCLQ